MPNISNGTLNRIWFQTVRYIKYKTNGLNLSKTAEDIAAETIEYVIKNKNVTWEDTPTSEKRLAAVARKVAKWHICKEIKKRKHAIVSYELDAPTEGIDVEPLEISKLESDYIKELHYEAQGNTDMKEIGRLALSRLDGFLAKKGVSSRDIRIYKDRTLYMMSTDVACKKHSINPSNLYRIVSVINGILATGGRTLVHEQ